MLVGWIVGYWSRQQHLFQENLKIRSIVALDKFLPEVDLEWFIWSDLDWFKDSLNRFEYNIWNKTITYHINEYDGTGLYPDKKSFQIEDADFDTFVPLIAGRAKDKNNLYQYGKNMNIPSSGAKLMYTYIIVSTWVYYYGDFESGGILLLSWVDFPTFSLLTSKNWWNISLFSKDKNNIYFNNRIITGLDMNTIEYIGNVIFKDKNGVYQRNKLLTGVDKDSIEEVWYWYFKDKNNIYYLSHMVWSGLVVQSWIDYSTFEKIDDYRGLTKDKNNYYLNGKIYTGKWITHYK